MKFPRIRPCVGRGSALIARPYGIKGFKFLHQSALPDRAHAVSTRFWTYGTIGRFSVDEHTGWNVSAQTLLSCFSLQPDQPGISARIEKQMSKDSRNVPAWQQFLEVLRQLPSGHQITCCSQFFLNLCNKIYCSGGIFVLSTCNESKTRHPWIKTSC